MQPRFYQYLLLDGETRKGESYKRGVGEGETKTKKSRRHPTAANSLLLLLLVVTLRLLLLLGSPRPRPRRVEHRRDVLSPVPVRLAHHDGRGGQRRRGGRGGEARARERRRGAPSPRLRRGVRRRSRRPLRVEVVENNVLRAREAGRDPPEAGGGACQCSAVPRVDGGLGRDLSDVRWRCKTCSQVHSRYDVLRRTCRKGLPQNRQIPTSM